MPTIGPISVAADADDGQIGWGGGGWLFFGQGESGNSIYVGDWDNEHVYGFFRFILPSTVPAGATFDAAQCKLELYGRDAYQWIDGTSDLAVFGTDANNPAAPSGTSNRPSADGGDTPLTTAFGQIDNVTWAQNAYNTLIGSGSNTIAAVLQELHDSYGLDSGDAVILWVRGGNGFMGVDDGRQVGIEDYSHAGANPARLTLVYSTGGDTALEADVTSTSTVAGALNTAINLDADVVSQSSVSGALDTAIWPSAAVTSQSTVTGAVDSAILLESDTASESTVAGDLDTSVTLAADVTSQSTVAADLAAAPSITACDPSTGPDTGGTEVAVTGYNFEPGTELYWHGILITTKTYNSPTSYTITTPEHSAGAIPVRAYNGPGEDSGEIYGLFEYTGDEPPVLISVVPGSGPDNQQTAVTVNCTGAEAGDTIEFDGVAATSVVIVSALEITCVTPTGTGTVDVTLIRGGTVVATLVDGYTYVASLAADVASLSTVSGALTTEIPLTAATVSVSTVNGTLTTAIPLEGAAASISTVQGQLSTDVRLSAQFLTTSVVTAGLATEILMAAAVQDVSTVMADLTTGGEGLGANVASVSTVAADLLTAIQMQGATASESTVQAPLTTAVLMALQIQGQSDVAATLDTAIRVAANGQAESFVLATLTTAITLEGHAVSESTVTANLTAPGAGFAANVQSVSTVGAELTTAIPLLAAVVSLSTVTGALSGPPVELASAVVSLSNVTADLTAQIELSAAVVAQSIAAGGLTTSIRLDAAVLSLSVINATLGSGPVLGTILQPRVRMLSGSKGREVVHVGRDNPQIWALDISGVTVNHSLITRTAIVLSSTLKVDSAANPELFDFTDPSRFAMQLGRAGIPAGRYRAELIVFDNAAPVRGYTWATGIPITFRDSIIP
jgi:hypothetical protein